MDRSQSHLDHLLESIEKKRLLSIREFPKTDLNRNTDLEDVTAWYSQLATLVRSNPPNRYVRCLQIFEDEQGRIRKVDYDYFKPTETEIDDTVFVISRTLHSNNKERTRK